MRQYLNVSQDSLFLVLYCDVIRLNRFDFSASTLEFARFADILKNCMGHQVFGEYADRFSCFYIENAYSNFTFCGAPHNFIKTSTPLIPAYYELNYNEHPLNEQISLH